MRLPAKLARIAPLLVVCGLTVFPETGPPAIQPSVSGLPAAFRITPARKGIFYFMDAVYNSKTDRFVAFYVESFTRDTIYSRVFDSAGRALGGPVKIVEANPKTLGLVSVAYNPVQDEIFLVGAEGDYDEIKGIPLDGSGRLRGGALTVIQIKTKTTIYSGLTPRVYWIPATNQYAVTWGHSWWQKPLDPLNGHYLAVCDKDFTLVSGPRFVRPQTAKNNNCMAYVVPYADGLVWGSAEDGAGQTLKPVVWFTDFKGKILTKYGKKGFLYPEPAGGYSCFVHPTLDPDSQRVLLVWVMTDALYPWDATKAENHYRLLGLDGRFSSPVKKIPKKRPFQTTPRAVYLTSDKRYFLVCPEYEEVAVLNPMLYDYQGKLWGFYMDPKGTLVTKAGAPGAVPIPLTGTFTDPKVGLRLDSLSGPAANGGLFVAYELEQVSGLTSESWGLIYK